MSQKTLQQISQTAYVWDTNNVTVDMVAAGAQIRIAIALERMANHVAEMNREAFRTRVAIERMDRRLAKKVPLR